MKTITVVLHGGVSPETFAKRAFLLLYRASEPAGGMGTFQKRIRPSEEEIYQNVQTRGDYVSSIPRSHIFPLGADYVFGRRVKWECRLEPERVVIPNYPSDWKTKDFVDFYPTLESLIEAVAKSLNLQGQYELIYKPKRRKPATS